MYSGKLSKGGTEFNCNLIKADSASHAMTELHDSVNTLEAMGFVRSYDDSTSWTGSFMYNGGIVFGTTFIVTNTNWVVTIFAS
jgi:hypothetical protein